jgi:hypothetical protein
MNPQNDLDQQLNAFLREGPSELPYQSFDAVRDRMEQTSQRVAIGPWRTPIMNRFVTLGLGAVAVAAVVFVGAQLFARPSTNPGAGNPTPTQQETAKPTPSQFAGGEPSVGPFAINDGDLRVTVDLASRGWTADPSLDYMHKNDDGLDAPETVGAALIAWTWPAGTGFNVYQDPCHWKTTIPKNPATTPDQIAAAFATQASTAASAPVDVTVGGYAGKAVTLHVPMSFHIPDAGREEEFADCDANVFAFYGIEGEKGEARNAQGPGQIDELWILDVEGSIVILDAAFSPATPADLVEETRTLAESATFGAR